MGVSTGPEGLLLRLFHRHHRKALSFPYTPLVYSISLLFSTPPPGAVAVLMTFVIRLEYHPDIFRIKQA